MKEKLTQNIASNAYCSLHNFNDNFHYIHYILCLSFLMLPYDSFAMYTFSFVP